MQSKKAQFSFNFYVIDIMVIQCQIQEFLIEQNNKFKITEKQTIVS